MPPTFRRDAAGYSDAVLADRYGVSTPTIRRWRQATGLAAKRATMPPDMAKRVAGMSAREAAKVLGIHHTTACRWLATIGINRRRGRQYAGDVPADWVDVCAGSNQQQAARHYGVNRHVVLRWARESGTAPRKGAQGRPAGPQKPTQTPWRQTRSAVAPRPEQPDARPTETVVTPIRSGCMDCTPKAQCRACTAAQVQADIDAWLAAGNRPLEVPVGVSGRAA